MYFENNKLYIHRSWTGFCLYIISVSENGMICNAQVNRNKEQYTNFSDDYDKYMIASLIYKLVDRKDESRAMFDRALETQKNNDKEEVQDLEQMFPGFPWFEDAVTQNDIVENKAEINENKVQDFMNKFIDEYEEE
jgi:predicted Zn-dependent protease